MTWPYLAALAYAGALCYAWVARRVWLTLPPHEPGCWCGEFGCERGFQNGLLAALWPVALTVRWALWPVARAFLAPFRAVLRGGSSKEAPDGR